MIVQFNDKAIQQFKAILNKSGNPDGILKIGIREGGCSGMSYTMDMVKSIEVEHTVETVGGVKIAIEKSHEPYLKGVLVEYNDSILNSGFKFSNPNAEESCGCGSSFNTKKA